MLGMSIFIVFILYFLIIEIELIFFFRILKFVIYYWINIYYYRIPDQVKKIIEYKMKSLVEKRRENHRKISVVVSCFFIFQTLFLNSIMQSIQKRTVMSWLSTLLRSGL